MLWPAMKLLGAGLLICTRECSRVMLLSAWYAGQWLTKMRLPLRKATVYPHIRASWGSWPAHQPLGAGASK
jgi:hypothetical protein